MIKKLIIFFLLLITLILPVSAAENAPQVSAKAAVLLCADSGEVLYAKNEHEKLSMASTTKIMTALLTTEANTPDKIITVTKEMVSVEGTSMGLQAGDRVSFEGLVYGMLLPSGNDAANAAAYALAGSPQKFALKMNEKAKLIGMKNTNFVTPSGLDAEEHYSTAYDMALLGAYAVKNPEFKQACSSNSKKLQYGNPPYWRRLTNHNRLLSSYEGAFGIKTGFTKKSGRCLVSAAERDGITLVAVTLNAPNDWSDHEKLFDYGFSAVNKKELKFDASRLSVNVIGGDKKHVGVVQGEEAFDIYAKTPAKLSAVEFKSIEYAPIRKGDILGYAVYSREGGETFKIPLTAAEDVQCVTVPAETAKPKVGFFKRIWQYIKKIF